MFLAVKYPRPRRAHHLVSGEREEIGIELPHVDLVMRHRLRRVCDPKEIANRGKMFPGSDTPSHRQVGMHPLEAAGVISRE